jgi:bla regulator protein BlaR1
MMPDLVARVILTASDSFELSMTAKATIVLALALLGVRCARTARASVRHVMLASAFGVLLLLPIVVLVLPPWPVSIPEPSPRVLHSERQVDLRLLDARQHVVVVERVELAPSWSAPVRTAILLRGAWSGIAMLSLAPVAAALWRSRSLRRRGLPWLKRAPLVRALALQAGVRRHVDLLLQMDVVAPLTCGFSRPAVMLPIDADGWNERQIRQAVIHELEHVRRADSAIQLAARIVCALYWFHPLVWVAWRRLCLESERACDDAVLRDSERTEYAEQLVTLAARLSSRAWQPVLSMANRSDLSARIEAILDGRQSRGRAGLLSASLTIAAAGILVLAISPLRAVTSAQVQAPGAAPAFDVASVKPNHSGDIRVVIQAMPGGRYMATNATLRILIRDAYALESFQLLGGPGWLDSDRFDISAKAPGNPTPAQQRLMLRALLEERFKLSVHTETRDLPRYALVLARTDGKLGPQLRRTGTDCSQAPEWIGTGPPPARGPDSPCRSAGPGVGGAMRFRGITLDAFAKFLATPVRRPVIDRTGLAGDFDIELGMSTEFGPPPPPPGQPDQVDRTSAPSIFTALQEQLGLKLDPQRGPVDVLVIDHVERPVPN